MTAASNSEARKRLIEAQERAECPLSQPIPAPVDSGAIGRLNEAETRDLLLRLLVDEYGDEEWAELGSLRRIARFVNDHFERIVREHTDRALAEVHDLIDHQAINVGDALAIVRAARQEAPEHVTPACICPTDDYCPRCHPRWRANWSAARQERGR